MHLYTTQHHRSQIALCNNELSMCTLKRRRPLDSENDPMATDTPSGAGAGFLLQRFNVIWPWERWGHWWLVHRPVRVQHRTLQARPNQ